jgi:uncharacterized protein (TIGR02646 family)
VRKLDRALVKVLMNWSDLIAKAIPDPEKFREKAEEFEKLDIDDPVRRAGFRSFAPEVLPQCGKKGKDFKPIWGKAKQALAAMSYQKCAYCEAVLNSEISAAVEHFKPKSLFPSLVYEWANYFLGCCGCNGAKLDKWPAGEGTYVRPDEEEPAAFFVFSEDGGIQPADPGGAADLTIKDFGLNRAWLRRARLQAIRTLLSDLEDVLGDSAIPEDARERWARRMFEGLLIPECAYSEALRQCFVRCWNARFPGKPL